MKKILFAIPIVILCMTVYGQRGELGIFGGGSYYIGDINPVKHFLMTRPAYGVFYRYNFDTRFAILGSYTRGELTADDAVAKFIPERKLSFSSPVNDFTFRAEFNFLDFFIGSKKSYFSPFIFAGITVFQFNPRSNGVALKPLQTEGVPYSTIAFALPFGIGFKYSVSDKIGIGIEWGMRKTTTDYLDDVSTTYHFKDLARVNNEFNYQSDPTGTYDNLGIYRPTYEQGMQRGNSQNKDWYNFTGAFISYKFSLFSRKKCKNLEFSN